jgi:hypothetical protein
MALSTELTVSAMGRQLSARSNPEADLVLDTAASQ